VGIAVSVASHPGRAILIFRCSRLALSKVSIAKTGSVWMPKPLPAMHQVADLILVPSDG
jgi:hypothetical protein